jgi:hypothetical protein
MIKVWTGRLGISTKSTSRGASPCFKNCGAHSSTVTMDSIATQKTSITASIPLLSTEPIASQTLISSVPDQPSSAASTSTSTLLPQIGGSAAGGSASGELGAGTIAGIALGTIARLVLVSILIVLIRRGKTDTGQAAAQPAHHSYIANTGYKPYGHAWCGGKI